MATMTSLDTATRARLIRDCGATSRLLDYVEQAGYTPEQITDAFTGASVADVAAAVGYDLAADPSYAAPGAAAPSSAAPPRRDARASRRPPRVAVASRRGGNTYRAWLSFLSLAFGVGLALLMWRVDGYFGVAWLQKVPGLAAIPNTILWPPVWTWLIGMGVSAMQGAFWPRWAVYDATGTMIEPGSTPQEISTWLVVLLANIASSALGMMPSIAGLNLGGIVVPTEGRGLWGTAWVLAVIFALYPEWALTVFGRRLWHLLVPDSLTARIRAVTRGGAETLRVVLGLLPQRPRARVAVAGVVGIGLLAVAWNLLA
jgi:hypothetical protein